MTNFPPANNKDLIESLRSFLSFSQTNPLEYTCKSALYLLTHVPSSRHAVLEYIGTFYKVASILHLRYNISIKNADINVETQNLTQINQVNQVIELIETQLIQILEKSKNIDVWSLELSNWLIDMIGELIETPNMTIEEIISINSSTIVDGLDIWSNQCRPTQSILFLIQKCFSLVKRSTKLKIIDKILSSSIKYTNKFDWVLCYFSALDPKSIFEKILQLSFNEAHIIQNIDYLNNDLPQINVINFYAINYTSLVKEILNNFLLQSLSAENKNGIKTNLLFQFQMMSQSEALSNLLLNEYLDKSSNFKMLRGYLTPFLQHNNTIFLNLLIRALEKINNSITLFDLMINLVEWLLYQYKAYDYMNESEKNKYKSFEVFFSNFLDKLISIVYEKKSQKYNDSTPFLNNLNFINGSNWNILAKHFISILKVKNNFNCDKKIDDLIYKFIKFLCINCDKNVSSIFITELFFLPSSKRNPKGKDTILSKLRQEINSFYPNCYTDTIRSILIFFFNEKNSSLFSNFIENLITLYAWDLQNQNYMSKTWSGILIKRETFLGMFNFVSTRNAYQNFTLIFELYNKILANKHDDLLQLKLNLSDFIIVGNKLISIFFSLTTNINEENSFAITKSINELFNLVKNILMHLNNRGTLYNSILLRTIVDKIFANIINIKETSLNYDNSFNEDANLFKVNIEQINKEIPSHNSKLKKLRNSLIDHPIITTYKKQSKNEYHNILNISIIELLEIVCYKQKSNNLKQTTLIPIEFICANMCNLADLLVQYVILDQYFIDYQWPIIRQQTDVDENFEAEVEVIKLFIERDVYVQNKIENSNNNQILWMILEFLSYDEVAFRKCSPIIRSLLASLIIQWESFQEQSTLNVPKTLRITLRFLNLISKLMPKPLCYIVDIIPLISSYEAYITLLIIWKYLRNYFANSNKTSNNNSGLVTIQNQNHFESRPLKYIFQKNIGKLAHLYSKFFK